MHMISDFLKRHSVVAVYIFIGIISGVCILQQIALNQEKKDNQEMKDTLTKIGGTLDGIAATLDRMNQPRLSNQAKSAAEEAKQ